MVFRSPPSFCSGIPIFLQERSLFKNLSTVATEERKVHKYPHHKSVRNIYKESFTNLLQVGVKVAGFAPRVAALESVLYMIIDRIKDVPKPPDAEARKEAAQVGEKKQ